MVAISFMGRNNDDHITFKIESTFEIPAVVLQCSVSEFQSVLTFGAQMLDLCATSKICHDFDREIYSLKAQLTSKKDEFQDNIKLIEKINNQRIVDLQNSKRNEFQDQLRLVEKSYEERIADLKNSLTQSQKYIADFQKLYEQQIAQLEIKNQKYLEVVEEERKKLKTPVSKGQFGENWFHTLVEETTKWKLIDTSNIPHSCDYAAEICGERVFFEIKNYTNDVKSDEVKKFLRDLKEHNNVKIGVFVSLKTRIATKDGDKPILVEKFGEQWAIFVQYLEISVNLLFIVDEFIKILTTFETRQTENFDTGAQVYIEKVINDIENLIKRITADHKQRKKTEETNYLNTLTALKSLATVATMGAAFKQKA